jgi:hypothetical protein
VVRMRTSPPLVVDVVVVGSIFFISPLLRPDWKMHRQVNPLLRVNAVHLVLLILACDGDIYDGLHLRHGAHAWVDLWVCAGRKSALRVRVRGPPH